jgi:hypothetical protein
MKAHGGWRSGQSACGFYCPRSGSQVVCSEGDIAAFLRCFGRCHLSCDRRQADFAVSRHCKVWFVRPRLSVGRWRLGSDLQWLSNCSWVRGPRTSRTVQSGRARPFAALWEFVHAAISESRGGRSRELNHGSGICRSESGHPTGQGDNQVEHSPRFGVGRPPTRLSSETREQLESAASR